MVCADCRNPFARSVYFSISITSHPCLERMREKTIAPEGGANGVAPPSAGLRSAPALDGYRDLVHHPGHSRRLPGGSLRLFTLRPGPHSTPEDDLTAICFNGDPARFDPWFELNRVDHTGDAFDPADSPFRLLALIIPLDLALECHPSLVDDHFDLLPREWQLGLDRCDGVARDLGVRSLVREGQAHLQIVRQPDHAGHTLGGGFGFQLVHELGYEAAQSDDTVLHRYGNVRRVDARIRLEFCLDVPFDIAVRPHFNSSSAAR